MFAHNANNIRKKASEAGAWGDYLAATVLLDYNYQLLVDAFGETPYSEALDVSKLSPKYDDGKDIYAGLVADLEDAL